jgi:GalNAc-alpha-(1->4)-GalNAc-alpha-(1->3)-diNAcBac-PP-undecaprenol alpha-1,4-N-acetyl-D-galactosaminyltransferase
MKIAFVIQSLRLGGAEMILTQMANYWAEKDHEIYVILLSKSKSNNLSLSQKVSVKNIKFPYLSLPFLLKKISPDVVIPFMDQTILITLLLTRGTSLKIIAAERTYPSNHTIVRHTAPKWLRYIAAALRVFLYRYASAIVVQTNAAREYFSAAIKERVHVIPNPLFLNPEPAASLHLPEKTILGMGRLTPNKQFDLLIESFSLIADRHPEWSLVIIGEGELKEELETLRNKKNLDERILFPGKTSTPLSIFSQAKIFVLSSDFEGFPNVLCQAMACGCAVISTDCLAGPREIISGGVDGILVKSGDAKAIANELDRLIKDPALRQKLGQAAQKITDRLNVEKIMLSWERLIEQLLLGESF